MHKRPRKPSNSFGTSGRKGELFAKLASSVLSLCLTLVIVEFALRFFVPLDARNPAEFRVPHPVLGWVLEPGASYHYEMPEDTVSVAYNSQGWHDLEHAVDKPDGVFRILILGDSFMEAYSVELEDAFPRRLEELARTAGSNVEVINLGVAGYGTLQEYLALRDVGQRYKPDIVLLGFFDLNDLIDNSLELSSMLKPEGITTIARPYLDPKDPTGWTVIPGDFDLAQRRYAEQQAFLDAQRNNLTERLVALHLIRDDIERLRNLKSVKGEDSTTASFEKERNELALLGVNYCAEPAEYTKAWDTTERILAKLKEEVEAKGSKLIVFSIPARDEVSIEYMKEVSSNLAYPDKLCMEEAPGNGRLGIILTKLEIEYINLLPDFRRVTRENGIELYRHTDLHWNPEGHALAAGLVVSELIERRLLPTLVVPVSSTP